MDMCVFWDGVLGLEPLRFRSFCLFRPCALELRCLGWITGAGGVATVPRFQLRVRCPGACCARSGCRAAMSVAGALVAQGTM